MGIRTPDLLHAIGKVVGSIASERLDCSTAGANPAVLQVCGRRKTQVEIM